jgi:hypothetical protein
MMPTDGTQRAVAARRAPTTARHYVRRALAGAIWALAVLLIARAAVGGSDASAAAVAGDLGQREIRGRVYDLASGPDALIAGATVTWVDPRNPLARHTLRTDARGEFILPLSLRDSDVVRITSEAPGYDPLTISPRAVDLVYRFPIVELGLRPRAESVHRIAGHLAADSFCAGDQATRAIALLPTGRSTLSSDGGAFAFDGVADGDYVLRTGAGGPGVPVRVAGRDAVVQVSISCSAP